MDIHGGNVYDRQINIDFSVSINPLGAPQKVKETLPITARKIDRYPEYRGESLVENIAESLGISDEHIILTAGASEAFMAIVRALRVSEAVLFTPCFSGYEYAVNSMDIDIVNVPISQMEDYIDADTNPAGNRIYFLANPNNPTGKCLGDDIIAKVIRRADVENSYVVLDECFLPLAGRDNLSYVNHISNAASISRAKVNENVIVVRSFTKTYAMPSIRLGYIVLNNMGLKKQILKQLPEWNVSQLAIEAGKAALSDDEYINRSVELIIKEREFLISSLRALGIQVFDSDANFILFKLLSDELYDFLLDRGILIRDCSNFKGLSNGYYRIAVRDRAENEELIENVRLYMHRA